MTERLVWHVVKQYAGELSFRAVAPHDLRRYAECRIMPNPECGARSGGLRNGPLSEVGLENDAA